MTGLLFTTYDIGFILSSLFVTYNLRNMGVPRIIAWALVLFSIGSLLFALPHFLSGLYQYSSTDREGNVDLFYLGPLSITCEGLLTFSLAEIIENGFLEVIENVPNAYDHLFSKTGFNRKLPENRYLSVFHIK